MRAARTIGLLALLAASARGDDWSHLGRDAARTRVPAESIAAPAVLATAATGSASIASPVASDGFLVIGGLDGVVRAFDEGDLSLRWSAPTGSPIVSTPLIERGRIFAPSLDGVLRILRLADGALLGYLDLGGSNYSSPVLSGSRLFLACGFPGTSLVAVDLSLNAIAWKTPLDQVTYASPAVGGGKVVIGTNNGSVSAYDEATGVQAWTTAVGGALGASSPLIFGNSVYCLCAGTLTRLNLDTGAAVGVPLTMTDTPPPFTLSVQVAGSSLALVNGALMGTLRFDYALDNDPDHDGFVDAWTLRDFAFAVDASSLAPAWPKLLLGERTDVDLNAIPPYEILPSPVSLGSSTAFASSLDPTLRWLSAGGALVGSSTLDAACQASLLLANARLYAVSRAGTLVALEDAATPQPLRATGLSPAGVEIPTTPGSLSWSGSGASYLVRIAQDGDLFMNWDYETAVVGAASIPCPPLADGNLYTWGVRSRSASGAWSPWSIAVFGQVPPVLPPGAMTATPGNRSMGLSWAASPSAGVAGYRLTTTPSAGGAGVTVDLGAVTSTTVFALTGGTSYTFELRAIDGLGFVSAPVTTTAVPLALITIGGVQYDTLSAALAAALPGDVVQLGAGTFVINATLQIPVGVTLRGLNARDTRIEASGPFVMVQALQAAAVRSLSLSGGSIGVRTNGNDVTIQNCVIRDMSDAGIETHGTSQVINNTIAGNAGAGLRASGRSDARNNIVQQNGVGFIGFILSTYNDVTDGYVVCVAAPSDLNVSVAFVNAGAGDYREQPFQPSLDAGVPSDDFSQEPALNGGRINLGAFGNTALAATSLTAGPPPSPPSSGSSPSGSSGGGCGLLGLEALLILILRRRRR